jgi:hypothetical protein
VGQEKDDKQWRFASTNLPKQYDCYIALSTSQTEAKASGASTSTQEAPTSSTASSSPHSPEFAITSQSQLNFSTPDITLCPTCHAPVVGTEEEVLPCTAVGCPRSFHSNCGLVLPNSDHVCTQACWDNISTTASP